MNFLDLISATFIQHREVYVDKLYTPHIYIRSNIILILRSVSDPQRSLNYSADLNSRSCSSVKRSARNEKEVRGEKNYFSANFSRLCCLTRVRRPSRYSSAIVRPSTIGRQHGHAVYALRRGFPVKSSREPSRCGANNRATIVNTVERSFMAVSG